MVDAAASGSVPLITCVPSFKSPRSSSALLFMIPLAHRFRTHPIYSYLTNELGMSPPESRQSDRYADSSEELQIDPMDEDGEDSGDEDEQGSGNENGFDSMDEGDDSEASGGGGSRKNPLGVPSANHLLTVAARNAREEALFLPSYDSSSFSSSSSSSLILTNVLTIVLILILTSSQILIRPPPSS